MTSRLIKGTLRVVTMLVVFLLAIAGFSLAKNQGWLSPIGINSESHDSQVVRAIKRTQEVSLLSLGIDGIKETDTTGSLFGKDVPGSRKQVFLRYTFDAKLGLDGAGVTIVKTRNSGYSITVPAFKFIGYSQPKFKVAAEDGGLLSFTTADIDKLEMVNEILNSKARQKYVDSYKDMLEEQTKAFYDRLVTSIDPNVKTSYRFAS